MRWSFSRRGLRLVVGAALLVGLLAPGSAAVAEVTALVGGVVIDGRGGAPLRDGVVLIDDGRIAAVGPARRLPIPRGAKRIDVRGKFLIPGLMNANVHLFSGYFVQVLVRYEDRQEDVIVEAAQLALKNGVTTVFDSWGPLRPLLSVRDRINRGELEGARMFVAGNIVGFDGPLSNDFNRAGQSTVAPDFKKRTNALWEEGAGAHLMYLPPDQLRVEIRKYIARGVDFVKYAAAGHNIEEARLIGFSPEAQRVIVEEAHAAGLTAQSHTMSVESVRIVIEAGADILQHCEATGPVLLPQATIASLRARPTYCAILPRTQKRLQIERQRTPPGLSADNNRSMDANVNAMIAAGAPILLSTDALFWPPELVVAPPGVQDEDVSTSLEEGHFLWLQAVQERGMEPMKALQAATRDIAAAYGKLDTLGTLESGKRADIVILDADPLAEARNYRKIAMVLKDGKVVDREGLPRKPVFTARKPASDTAGPR